MVHRYSVVPSIYEILLTEQNKYIEEMKATEKDYTKSICIKPWGYEFLAFQSKKLAVWCLTVFKNQSTSLHCHFKKDTQLIVLSGCAKITLFNGKVIPLSTMESLFIPRKTFHSISSFSDTTTIMEIEIFNNDVWFSNKDDLLRINDQYHREPVGYQSSVQIEKENLERYRYFEIQENMNHVVDNCRIQLKTLTNTITPEDNSHTILFHGHVLHNNTILKEGSILTPKQEYTVIDTCFVLTIKNFYWKEDAKIIHSMDHLDILKTQLKSSNNHIVLTSGCFDILHLGHLHILKEAKALGGILIVCLSSDEQIRILKGPTRPINRFQDRLDLFKTIDCVDYIFPYQEDFIETEESLGNIMKVVDPDIWVKGSDYTIQSIQKKHPYLRNIQIIPLLQEKSTTNIIKKISNQP